MKHSARKNWMSWTFLTVNFSSESIIYAVISHNDNLNFIRLKQYDVHSAGKPISTKFPVPVGW